MNLISISTLSLILLSCSPENKNKMGLFNKLFGRKVTLIHTDKNTEKTDALIQKNEYKNKLLATKDNYPFDKWRENYKDGLTQYTKENCNKIKKVFDDLITSLIEIGTNASEEQKKQLFTTAILKTNQLNEEIDGLIETGEREDLCELTNKITIACGLDPSKYGDGEGLASEWREW